MRPRDRLFAIILRASLADELSARDAAAWLNFYALALVEPEAARLLRVYHRRLRSNLMLCLRPLIGVDDGHRGADAGGADRRGLSARGAFATMAPPPRA
jgi:TetR/AcrR family transcriptional repressor of bet genes